MTPTNNPKSAFAPPKAEGVETQKALISVQPTWCLALPVQQQSVLLLGARGPDGIAKAHAAKRIQRAYRASVLVAARYGRQLEWNEKADTFMCLSEFGDSAKWTHAVEQFFHYADDLPHHFYMHLIHGAEILGYKHPDVRFRLRWQEFYGLAVKDFHLTPETELEMDARLADWERKHWTIPSVGRGNAANPPPDNPKTERSKCCNWPVEIKSADEGTNHYSCTRCGQPCDSLAAAAEDVAGEIWTITGAQNEFAYIKCGEATIGTCGPNMAMLISTAHNSCVSRLKEQIKTLETRYKAADKGLRKSIEFY